MGSWQLWFRRMLLVLVIGLSFVIAAAPAQAGVDPYVARYLRATEPVPLVVDGQGQTRLFTPEELANGKRLFENNCMNCHVGGATLPNPPVSLSQSTLQGATPPRNTIAGMVAYMRQPMTYDGTEEAYLCRQVPETWLEEAQVENLAAFILRAAEKAPGWGSEEF